MKSISEARSGNVMPVVVKIAIASRKAIPGKNVPTRPFGLHSK
jgi:hypothetical protein